MKKLLGSPARRTIFHLAAAGIVAASLASSGGCSFVVNADAHQCTTSADCAAFIGTVCSDRNVCVSGGTGCATNSQCIDRYGADTYFCKKDAGKTAGTCTNVVNDICPQLLADPGDLRNDETVISSVFFMPSWFPLLKGGVDAVELARRDFKTTAGGLPPIHGGKPRPLVFIECDVPFGDQDKNRDATNHLIDDVGIQGSIGPITGDWMSYYLTRAVQLKEAGPMLVTTGTRFPGFENIPGAQSLFFTVGLPSDGKGKSEAAVVPYFEKMIRDSGVTTPIKVAFAGPGTSTYTAVQEAFSDAVKFNGKSSQENTPNNYKEFGWGDTSDATSVGYTNVVAGILQFKPDIVVCDGSTLCADIVPAIDKSGQLPKAYYIIGQEGEQSELSDYIGTNESLRKRVLGTSPGRADQDLRVTRFKTRFLQTFNAPDEAQGFATAAYDMAYEMHYAIAALGDKPVTGVSLGKTLLDRFKQGGFASNTYDAANAILKTYAALQAGQNIDLDGVSHHAYFDSNGQALYEVQVWCIDANTTLPNRFTTTGLSFVQGGTEVTGTNSCF